ncbi:hypothetical protein SS1G_03234 [Sclerotinia sclerotiorum 1980 UF-70]|uniref:Rho-GAP domain-containing protein n=1 Tax=Sclerotinia sclerotiorum (strain ATCC 18683 / 1980 / Ss-1) TaxID=665079 RepID=A7ED45_SCLS1|nr:hypothetical protein SS1G_03234 [Sclerotinia sclerotiorum 1980 UF-70]EDO00761.1 hypothetical protein SS1G_03234 [Sclerotinia sclerotiorum 1980 UF-70]
MPANSYRLNSRASSATLSLRRQQQEAPLFIDDASIAQNLLRGQVIPIRRASIRAFPSDPNISLGLYGDAPSHAGESSNIVQQPRTRRGLCSSNTWTSSSGGDGPDKHGNWLSRKIFRRTSSSQTPVVKSKKAERRDLKRMRSISDSLRLKGRRDSLKDRDLVELVRLCGSSLLYLPAEYAPSSLTLPTCIRATAQYLIQHAPTTRGIFRIPGSQHTIGLIYEHYSSKGDEGHIAGTVRCPTLPDHIDCDVHDVASAFKRFLSGLLCMVGRAAETARREDDKGRPLPTSDLMGYKPLGVCFGPLLVGDLMDNYNIRLANGHGSLVLTPVSPPKTKKERKKYKSAEEGVTFNNTVDKIKVACEIMEMLITHWRDIVRHMKNLDALTAVNGCKSAGLRGRKPPMLRPSMSESFSLRRPPDWTYDKPDRNIDRSQSPTPPQRKLSPRSCPVHIDTMSNRGEITQQRALDDSAHSSQLDSLLVTKQRSRQRLLPGEVLKNTKSTSALSAALVQEHPDENDFEDSKLSFMQTPQSGGPPPSTRNGKGNDQKSPAAEHNSGRHVKCIVRNFESESTEAEVLLPDTDSKDFGHDKTPKAQSIKQSPDRESKETKTTSLSGLLHDNNRNSRQGSSPTYRNNPPSRDNHIRFAPSTSHAPESKDPRRFPGFTSSEPSKGNSPIDPISRVSHEDDLASLAVLGQALESPDLSMKSVKSAEKFEKSTKHDSGVDFHERTEAEKPHTPNFSRPQAPRNNVSYTPNSATIHKPDGHSSSKSNFSQKTGSAAPLVTTSVEPKVTQAKGKRPHETASPATLSKVASIREMFRKRKSESRSSKSSEDHHKSEPSRSVIEHHAEPRSRKIPTPEPTSTPKKVSVRAIAEKFDTVKATPPPPVSPTPAKSARPAATTSVDNRRGGGVVSPYTINPPSSPSRSIASIKSGKSIRSFRNVGLAQRFQQTQEQSSPTKIPAPKRILRDFVPESTSPKAIIEDSHEDSVSSLKLPLSTFNSLSVPLKPVGNQPSMKIRTAGMDGAYSSIGSSETLALMSSEFEAAHKFLHSQSLLAHDATLSKNTLSRGNTVLHSQIRSLQQQLSEKTEQVRHLQRMVEMRSSSDTEHISLAEQLREAREEVETWRRRAEGAERKLELMEIIGTRNNTRMEEQRGLSYQTRGVQAGDVIGMHGRGYSVDGGMTRMISKRRMVDTTSSEDSTESNGTVVREMIRRDENRGEIDMEIVSDQAGHNNWASQTLSIMDGLKSWEN